jgi:hypothetical protein
VYRSILAPSAVLLSLLALLGLAYHGPPSQTSGSNTASVTTAYDEQILLSFKQSFTSLSYNVSAVEQCGSEGGGPAYLLNGLSDSGYWYQVALSWKWGYPSIPRFGFNAIYAVFAPNGTEVFLSGQRRTVLDAIEVNGGDSVLLSLSFSNGNVTMYAHDWETGSSAKEEYSGAGATRFIGTPNQPLNANGFFTGLMTEQYHSNPYYGGEQRVSYSGSTNLLFSAWAQIDEFEYPSHSSHFRNQSSIVYNNPFQFQNFASDGAFETSNASEFITGQLNGGPTCAPLQWLNYWYPWVSYWYLIPIVAGIIISISVGVWRARRRRPSTRNTFAVSEEPHLGTSIH